MLTDEENKMKQLMILVTTFLLLTGCFSTMRVGELKTDSQQVQLGNAERVDVDIRMGAGKLDVSGGDTTDLLDATLTYNVAEWEPQITYEESDGVGHLEVRQPDGEEIGWNNDMQYEWSLRFNEDLPMNMDVQMGAGQSNFDLEMLNLDALRIETGAGETTVDLHGGRVRNLDVSTGAGKVALDLGGEWDHDLNGRIRGGVGELIVTLPAENNVEVRVQGGLGAINASGLTHSGDTYSHNAGSESTLMLDIEGGIGQITLALES
jgi:hypothetical protein